MAKSINTTAGSLDECRPLRRLLRRDKFAIVTGEQAFVRGWLAPPLKQKPIRTLRLHLSNTICEVPYGFVRRDVASSLRLRDDRVGFEGTVNVSSDLLYEAELSVTALLTDGTLVVTDQVKSAACYVVSNVTPIPLPDTVKRDALSRFRIIADAVPAEPLHGRSRRSIRDDTAVEVSGWILDRRRRGPGNRCALLLRKDGRLIGSFAAKRIFDGEASAIVGQHVEAGFRARINMSDLTPGLYSLAPAVLDEDGWISGAEEAFERCVAYDPAPRFLPVFRQPALGTVSFLGSGKIQRGSPLAVRGWAKDPISGDAGRGVYARLDDHHFLPLPSNLNDPAAEESSHGNGFSGIIDTTGLLPGSHRLDIAVFSKGGAGWYTIATREVEISA